MIRRKLRGGALYVSVIISILISVILGLFILLAYYNTRTAQAQGLAGQLELSLESGFALARSAYYDPTLSGSWQKMPYNNDSVSIRKTAWGCYTLIRVKAKNVRARMGKAGLFGTTAWKDTALVLAEQNRQIGLAGKIRLRGSCYFPKVGVKTAYIEGNGFSDLSSIRPYIRQAPDYIPALHEAYLEAIAQSQSGLDLYNDSLLSFLPDSWDQSFGAKSAVLQQGAISLRDQTLKNNMRLIATDVVTVDKSCNLSQVLLVARKVVFRKGFIGSVHVIASDSIVAEDNCLFSYPSSFCVYKASVPDTAKGKVRGIFFGSGCSFGGGLLAANDPKNASRMIVRLNKAFRLIGNLYSSDYADIQGLIYGTVICRTLLLQTPSGIYENHLYNCLLDPKRYGTGLAVPAWLKQKDYELRCAQWL